MYEFKINFGNGSLKYVQYIHELKINIYIIILMIAFTVQNML